MFFLRYATVAALCIFVLSACTVHQHYYPTRPASPEAEKVTLPPPEALGPIIPSASERAFWDSLTAFTVRVRKGTGRGGGSGVVVSKDGLILTAGHVTRGGAVFEVARVRLESDGTFTEYAWSHADLVRRNETHDIALLRLREPPKDLPAIRIADETEIKEGDYLYRLGFGDTRLTKGPLLRKDVRFDGKDHLLELGLIGGPGASGGPVFDGKGRLVGVELASDRSEGSYPAYALPMKYALETVMRD